MDLDIEEEDLENKIEDIVEKTTETKSDVNKVIKRYEKAVEDKEDTFVNIHTTLNNKRVLQRVFKAWVVSSRISKSSRKLERNIFFRVNAIHCMKCFKYFNSIPVITSKVKTSQRHLEGIEIVNSLIVKD